MILGGGGGNPPFLRVLYETLVISRYTQVPVTLRHSIRQTFTVARLMPQHPRTQSHYWLAISISLVKSTRAL